jgi:hypothetical protein
LTRSGRLRGTPQIEDIKIEILRLNAGQHNRSNEGAFVLRRLGYVLGYQSHGGIHYRMTEQDLAVAVSRTVKRMRELPIVLSKSGKREA